jgi:hypothetical protein
MATREELERKLRKELEETGDIEITQEEAILIAINGIEKLTGRKVTVKELQAIFNRERNKEDAL